VYALKRSNSLVGDPLNPDFSVQHGEVRSRGLELEAKTRIGRHANLVAGYAYTDARTVRSSVLTPEQDGQRATGVPYHQLALWGDYSFGAFDLPGLKAGLGMRHVGATRTATAGVEVPAFTLFDAMLSYATGPWKFALNLSNLADKTYIAQCSGLCFYGEPRRATATASYRW
jgi:iron complex outermembrane receptor protein